MLCHIRQLTTIDKMTHSNKEENSNIIRMHIRTRKNACMPVHKHLENCHQKTGIKWNNHRSAFSNKVRHIYTQATPQATHTWHHTLDA